MIKNYHDQGGKLHMFNNNANGYTLSDIAAVTGNSRSGGSSGNDGFGFDGNGSWIFLLFILFLIGGWNNNNNGGGGYGNNSGGGGGSMMPFVTNDIQRGFDQQTLTSGIAGLQNGIYGLSTQLCNCCADMQQSVCNGFAGVNSNVSNGFAQAEIANNARQIADMNQLFALQTGLSNQLNNIAMNQQQCLNAIGTCAA